MKPKSPKPSTGPAVHCAHDKLVRLDSLKPHPRNPNSHGEDQIKMLAKMIKHYGWRAPIVVSKQSGFIVAGHCRLASAKLLGLAEAPVNVQSFKSKADELAFLVADNRIAELAEMSESDLAAILSELKAENFDLDLAGFDADALGELNLGGETEVDAEPQIDRAAELQKEWKTKLGQLWALDSHSLLCGDSTKREDVERGMGGERAAILITDPPYNVEYEGNYIQSGTILKKENKIWSGGIANDNLKDFAGWLAGAFQCCDNAMEDGCSIYVWHPSGEDGKHFWASWPYDKWHFQVDLVWNKLSLIISRWDYKPQHEPCFYGWKGKNRDWSGANNESTVWDHARQQGNSGEVRGHPTQKPTELFIKAIRNHSGAIVFDPFLGSGTTLIACENLGRKCRAIEIDPGYVAVALQRWADATGKTPKLLK